MVKPDIVEHFEYDPMTGNLYRTRRNHKAGKLGLVTAKDSHGYIIVSHKGRKLKGHRLAWLLQTGTLPTCEIDHINRDRSDNRWCNLRLATSSENSQNCSVRADNKSGVSGVYYVASINQWWAYINVNRRRICLGYHPTLDSAAAARKAAESVYHPRRSA
jgi:hypothetical protein